MSRTHVGRLAAALAVPALLALPAAAQAFCGTYVGEAGAELTSGASQVVLTRQGQRTTLTLANDVSGSVKDFAVVIPVPEVLSEDDVRVLPDSIMDTVREYSGPRLVEYQCSDFAYGPSMGSSGCHGIGCAETGFTAMADSGSLQGGDSLDVTVEAEFAAGEYDIVILSSEDSADLLTWLDQEGYGVSTEAEELLGEYIEADSKFLAAKVRLDDVPTTGGFEGRPFLSPLQIAYTSSAFSLPIRLGTVNSPGTQDLVVYAVTEARQGPVGIANYDEVAWTIDDNENDCLYDESALGPIDDYLDAKMDDAVDERGGAAWSMTYTWGPAKCDPCPPGGPLDDDVLSDLGFQGSGQDAQFTRLWMRYDAQAATQDLVLYGTGDFVQTQLRYIVHKDGLEAYFPVCEQGWVEDYTACPDDAEDEAQDASIAPWWFGLSALGLFTGLGVVLRRRR